MQAMSPTNDRTSGIDDARYERKYLLMQPAATVRRFVQQHPAIFYEKYPARRVFSLYCDTNDVVDFHQNVAGVSQRQKTRLRWYQQRAASAASLQFECKYKSGFLVRKTVLPVEALSVPALDITADGRFQASQFFELQRSIPALQARMPTIANAYQRQYFSSRRYPVRITIDSDVQFAPLRRQGNKYQIQWSPTERLPATVLELKYPPEMDEVVHTIVRGLPGRYTALSKYVYGMRSWREELRWL